MSLTSQQLRYLRGLTHNLQPVVMVGDKGLNENVMSEIEIALNFHELVKIKLRTDRNSRKEMIEVIGDKFKAEKVQTIGQVACFFRRNPKKPVIALPISKKK